jgi:hypothetical protein
MSSNEWTRAGGIQPETELVARMMAAIRNKALPIELNYLLKLLFVKTRMSVKIRLKQTKIRGDDAPAVRYK